MVRYIKYEFVLFLVGIVDLNEFKVIFEWMQIKKIRFKINFIKILKVNLELG